MGFPPVLEYWEGITAVGAKGQTCAVREGLAQPPRKRCPQNYEADRGRGKTMQARRARRRQRSVRSSSRLVMKESPIPVESSCPYHSMPGMAPSAGRTANGAGASLIRCDK